MVACVAPSVLRQTIGQTIAPSNTLLYPPNRQSDYRTTGIQRQCYEFVIHGIGATVPSPAGVLSDVCATYFKYHMARDCLATSADSEYKSDRPLPPGLARPGRLNNVPKN